VVARDIWDSPSPPLTVNDVPVFLSPADISRGAGEGASGSEIEWTMEMNDPGCEWKRP
jgi:hypothetical protein